MTRFNLLYCSTNSFEGPFKAFHRVTQKFHPEIREVIEWLNAAEIDYTFVFDIVHDVDRNWFFSVNVTNDADACLLRFEFPWLPIGPCGGIEEFMKNAVAVP